MTEKELHRMQRNLREMIDAAPALRDFLCKTGQCDSRDTLSEGAGNLQIAEAKLGRLSFKDANGNQVEPLSGDK